MASWQARAETSLLHIANAKRWLFPPPASDGGLDAGALRKLQRRADTPRGRGFSVARLDVDGCPMYKIRATASGASIVAATSTEAGGANIGVVAADSAEGAILYFHGGGFIAPPMRLHWLAARDLAARTGFAVYFARYPLLPEADTARIFGHAARAHDAAAANHGRRLDAVMGDSAGATLAFYLASKLDAARQPARFVMFSPCSDISLANPGILALQDVDPLLRLDTVRAMSHALLATARNEDISPLCLPYANLAASGARLSLYTGGREILYPDTELLHRRLLAEGIDHEYVCEPELFHVWPLAPFLPESAAALARICESITADTVEAGAVNASAAAAAQARQARDML